MQLTGRKRFALLEGYVAGPPLISDVSRQSEKDIVCQEAKARSS